MALALDYIQVGLASRLNNVVDVSSDCASLISLADANQCMRVSSALESGTVSDPAVTLFDPSRCSPAETVIRLISILLS